MDTHILNVSKDTLITGNHLFTKDDILIQICDICSDFCTPYHKFKIIYYFEFADIEPGDKHFYDMEEFAFSSTHAKKIVEIFKDAWYHDQNIVVQCNKGLSRSGAICDAGIIFGFSDIGTHKTPNQYIKNMLLKEMSMII